MRGEWFAWLSHDDVWLPEKLERQVYFLRESNHFKACYTDVYIVDSKGQMLTAVSAPWYPREQAIRVLFGDMYINGSTMLIERGCFDEVGLFSERLKYVQDGEMWLRLIRRFDIGHLPEKLVKQRSHPSQGSVRLKVMHREEVKNLYEHIFKEWGIGVIFPELSDSMNNHRTMARAHTWFGDTMAFHRGYYDLANEQYRISKSLWPGWRNPARIRLFLGSRFFLFPKRLYHYFYHRLFSSRFPVIDIRRQ
jgi:hypothetical protein